MKNVFVTGGSGGIGSAIVENLAKQGYNVAIAYNNSKILAEALAEKFYNTIPIKCDVSSEISVETAFEIATKHFGKIDALVNCAGISYIGLLSEMSLEDWEKVLRVNLTGAFLCTNAVVSQMIRDKSGCIVNISSMWGEVGASCEVAYSASKAGLIGFTKALADELAPSGIRVNCVSPGLVDTAMNNLSTEDLEALHAEIPVGRSATSAEIAETVSFLISEKSSYITGQVFSVNGGMFML